MRIVIIGGGGQIGTRLTRVLVGRGHDPVPASPATGVDAVTGEGLAEALRGADAVVDVSNLVSTDDEALMRFFVTGTRNQLAAEAEAGVGHHLVLSIVNADRLSAFGYTRAKVAQEDLVVASGIDHCILRATQFYELIGPLAEAGADGDVVRASDALIRPVSADDVAMALADLVTGPPRGRVEMAGPETAGIDAWIRRLFAATGDGRRVVTDPDAGYFGAPIGERALIPDEGAELLLGTTTFDAWAAAMTPR